MYYIQLIYKIIIMFNHKSTVSARVPDAIKEIVNDSEYTHKDAYMIGAGVIAMGKAEETKSLIHENKDMKRSVKEKKCKLLREKEEQLKKELDDL